LDQVEFEEGQPAGWLEGARERAGRLEELLGQYPQSEPALVRAVSLAVDEGARVFLGNSLPIREWNLAASYAVRGLECWANRGANGIDGNVSSWLGWGGTGSAASWGIFGDLTALYDLNALWVLDQLPESRRRIVVLNNGGGGIFRRLPVLAGAGGEFGKLMRSEHRTGFEGWAALWGCEYWQWQAGARWPEGDGTAICEVRPDGGETEAFWQAWKRVGASGERG
jgi:2-succinyl-5-enolpyruvyl-6-hydroxy-3-cyclohexene-1-carboxylate synthase